jgi:hypothetical protein
MASEISRVQYSKILQAGLLMFFLKIFNSDTMIWQLK